MDKPPAKAPLAVWLCLAVSIAGLLGWIVYENATISRSSTESLEKNLRSRAAAGTGPVVLVIGTSLIQSGLDSTDRIVRCVEASAGKKIILLKCWQSGGDLIRLSSSHAGFFRGLRPDLVLVEANMLFYRPARTPFLSRYAQTFRDLLQQKAGSPYNPDERVDILPVTRGAIEAARAGLVDSSDLTLFRDICTQWEQGGSRIGLVDIPLEKELDKQKWMSPDTAAFFKNLQFLRERGPVSFYRSGVQLDSTNFFDFGHLNRKGNAAFAPWFCEMISGQIQLTSRTGKIPGQ